MKQRTTQDIFGTAFLDVISCGLGAVILMILFAKNEVLDFIPTDIIPTQVPSELVPLDIELINETKELATVLDELTIKKNELSQRLIRLNDNNLDIKNKIKKIKESNPNEPSMNESPLSPIYSGGVPVGRKYVIFIIDTSGSMQANWPIVMKTISSILDIHPKVTGLQILNDNGNYLIEGYKNKWIPDSKTARNRAINKLSNWMSLSNSDPSRGLEVALKTYSRRSNDLSIYVLGDDFTGESYDEVINTINKWNLNKNNGEKRAIIHGIGFPWGVGDRFGTLMREVAYQNSGVFIGLNLN